MMLTLCGPLQFSDYQLSRWKPTTLRNNHGNMRHAVTQTYEIDIEGSSSRLASKYAQELADRIRRTDPDVSVQRVKRDQSTLDLGVTLELIVSSGSALAIAEGIRSWLSKRQGAKISIKTTKGEILAAGVTSADTIRLTEIFTNQDE
jgi:hypothetical protein